MILRVTLLVIGLISFPFWVISQIQETTSGKELYWELGEEGDLFDLFKWNYWGNDVVSHRLAMQELPLFIRLEDDHFKISKLTKNGFLKEKEKQQKILDERNEKLVKAFKKRYRNDNYYFYYSKDSDKIFKEFDFSSLMKDMNTPADFELGDNLAIYVLIYRRPVWNLDDKNYIVHLWDLEKVSRIKNMEFLKYKNWFSYDVDIDKTIKKLVHYIWERH